MGGQNLLAALSRASGLPARTISGQMLPNTIPFIALTTIGAFPGQNSSWNEVFFNGSWGLVDPMLLAVFTSLQLSAGLMEDISFMLSRSAGKSFAEPA